MKPFVDQSLGQGPNMEWVSRVDGVEIVSVDVDLGVEHPRLGIVVYVVLHARVPQIDVTEIHCVVEGIFCLPADLRLILDLFQRRFDLPHTRPVGRV